MMPLAPIEPVDAGDPSAGGAFELLMATTLTLHDVAERLAISFRQVQAHVDDGSLIAVNVGRGGQRRDLRVLEEDLEGFLKRRRTSVERVATFPAARPERPSALPAKPDYAQRRAARLAGKKT
ncbi:hypothetical protein NS230_07810 [Methylobacterium indicum]|uniref:helix-turn-helix domain-containing protein n=2 Tax=Methylobacterium indicum TaxID=1775910 RepID=UPI0007E272C7|nr:helix-turn-helix domain-containing protein [Methylobacterium indicum]KTS53130.1 hypothetical protein NS230_07810 [Methylobacterium indicum]